MNYCLKIIFFTLFLLLSSCIGSINQYDKNEEELQKKLKQGDISCYNDLKILYLDYKPEGFINIAKFASDSLNYDYASLDVFECYFNKYNFDYDSLHKVDLCKMSKDDRKDALLYLRKALNQKVQEAKYYSSLNKPNCND